MASGAWSVFRFNDDRSFEEVERGLDAACAIRRACDLHREARGMHAFAPGSGKPSLGIAAAYGTLVAGTPIDPREPLARRREAEAMGTVKLPPIGVWWAVPNLSVADPFIGLVVQVDRNRSMFKLRSPGERGEERDFKAGEGVGIICEGDE